MQIKKASTLDDVYRAFTGSPISKEQLEEFYQPTAEARGGAHPRRRLERLLQQNQSTNEHYLFIGYRGCGKSTELNHLQKDLEQDFLVINFSVQDELDPVNINYIELFIVTMERLFHFADKHKLPISEMYLNSIHNWTKTSEIEEIKDNFMGIDTEFGGEANIGVPAILSFFAKFKASAKSSRQLKEKLTQNVEPKLSVLIDLCNDLIQEVRLKLDRVNKKDLLIIIEDLDKIPLDRAQTLFVNYTSQLTQLKANVIYTFPIALYYSTYFNDIKAYFSRPYELDMIKVSNRNGSDNEMGINTMKEIVAARMEAEQLFTDQHILRKMILKSGGVLRDLFIMITEAADNALDFGRSKINEEDYIRAYYQLKREYDNNIADRQEGSTLYSVNDYYQTLKDLYENETKQPPNTVHVMHLRQNLCILGYNGQGWCNVHPLVVDALKEREVI